MFSTLNYEMRGQLHSEPILLLHELGGSQASWSWIDHYLKDKFLRVIVDLPGAGNSPLLSPEMSLDDVGQSLVELMDYLNIDKINLAGVAYGAVVSAYLAASYPERIKAVMMISIGPSISERVAIYVRNRADQVERDGMGSVVDYSLKSSFPLGYATRYPDMIEKYREIFTSNHPHHYAVCSRSIANAGTILTERIQNIRSRAAVVGGGLDPTFTPEVVTEVANLLKTPVTPIIISEAGHFPQIQAPQELADIMIQYFLS
jgi:pimeloyl-ACP methyl ester carboxylesterase